MGSITKAEWRWVMLFAAIVIAVTTLPYALAYGAQGKASEFSGFLWGVQDGNSYIAKMREGADGAWLYRIRYTTEPQSGALIYLPYLWLGKLAGGAGMHDQLVALMQLARIAVLVFFLNVAYRWLAIFVEDSGVRKWALAIACLGGGFGWILVLSGRLPLEYYSPETFSFLELFGPPHLVAARGLLLLALLWYLSPSANQSHWLRGVGIGLALCGAWLFQPLDVPVAWAVMGAHVGLLFLQDNDKRTFFQREGFQRFGGRMVVAVAVSLPMFLYSAIAFQLDPVLRAWTAGNLVLSPDAWQYLSAYGVLLLPAIAAAVFARRDARVLFAAGWIVILPALVYFPIPLQRRLADGAWLAWVVLAAVWAERMLSARLRRIALPVMLGLSVATFGLLYLGSLNVAVHPAAPLFIPADQARASAWLDAHAPADTVVLSDFEAGNALPAYAHMTVFIGHGVETLDLMEKEKLVALIFDGARTDQEREAALLETRARYVLMGPAEFSASGGRVPGCVQVFAAGEWSVWLVNPPGK